MVCTLFAIVVLVLANNDCQFFKTIEPQLLWSIVPWSLLVAD